jgi:hypothetical protein
VSGRNARQRKRKVSTPARKAPVQKTKPWWRRVSVWTGGLGTAVATGVLVNILTLQAQRVTLPTAPTPKSPARIVPSGTSSSRSSGESGPAPSSSPLTVLSEDPLNIGQLVVWVFPAEFLPNKGQLSYVNSLIEAPGLESRPAFNRWFYSHGAYEPGGTSTQLVVENNRAYPVRIIDMNVAKICGPPLDGTLFFGAGGAVDATVGLGFNLDSPDTEAELAQGTSVNQWQPDYFTKYTISIQPGGQQVFDLWATTSRYACSYTYQMTILDGSRKIIQNIEDGDEPFRATALEISPQPPDLAFYRAVYIGGAGTKTGAFVRVDPASYRF